MNPAPALPPPASPTASGPAFIQQAPPGPQILDELAQGLGRPQAMVSPKFFYDELGSRLFDAITALDEYYPTRVEAALFAAHGEALAQATGPLATLVDLGAGNCRKAVSLFPWLRPRRYVAVDISADYLRATLAALQAEHPAMEVLGVGMDFTRSLALPEEVGPGPRTLFYPGSSLGNFDPDEAQAFLARMHRAAQGGALILGMDLVKDAAVLERAYDDALGVTAAFNLNMLRHLNRVAGTDFELADWRHRARWNAAASRIEMHLEARRALRVRWPGGGRSFEAGETLHTENSYKTTVEACTRRLQAAGWQGVRAWTDPQGAFAVFSARA